GRINDPGARQTRSASTLRWDKSAVVEEELVDGRSRFDALLVELIAGAVVKPVVLAAGDTHISERCAAAVWRVASPAAIDAPPHIDGGAGAEQVRICIRGRALRSAPCGWEEIVALAVHDQNASGVSGPAGVGGGH